MVQYRDPARKRNSICFFLSAAVMLGLPWLAITFVPADSAMAALLLMFFIVNPAAAASSGIFAGKNVSSSWFQPLLLTGLFILGSRIFFDMKSQDFMFYGILYLVIGYIFMAVTAFKGKKRQFPPC